MKEYTVKEVAELVGKHEETVKRWIRAGKFPRSYRNSDKEGWRILESDLRNLNDILPVESVKTDISDVEDNSNESVSEQNEIILGADETELVKLAYQAVTLTSPSDEILTVLSVVGIRRTLEILLIMQQSATKVRNVDGFIRKAIRENWSPTSIPIKIPKKRSEQLYKPTQQDFDQSKNRMEQRQNEKLPFYNWLES